MRSMIMPIVPSRRVGVAKADNLLAVLWLLRSRGRLSASQIAEELGTTVRTVYRYIDALCASGAPIAAEGGPGGGYLLLDTFREPPVFFDAEERTALLHASLFADRAGYPFSDAMQRALRKIRRRMDGRQLRELARHEDALGVVAQDPPSPGTEAGRLTELLGRIERAAAESRTLSIEYSKRERGASQRRTIEPYGVVYWRESWYVAAYCRLRKEIRLFRADRISTLAEGGERFERPAGFSAGDFLVRTLMPAAPKDDAIAVRIEGEPAAIDHLSRTWFLKSFVTARSDCALEVTVTREGANEHLPALLLGYGTSLRIAAPPEPAARLAALAAKVAAFHASSDNH